MKSKHLLYSVLIAIAIAGLFHLFGMNEYNFPEFHLKVGQIAEFDIIAPFDFAIRKPEVQLNREKEESVSKVPIPFSPAPEIAFEALKLIDSVLVIISQTKADEDIGEAVESLKKIDLEFTREALIPIRSPELMERARTALKTECGVIYEQGIYESASTDSIDLYDAMVLRRKSIKQLLSVDQARQTFTTAFSRTQYGRFAQEISSYLFNPNLIVNELKFKELKDRALSTLSTSQGMVSRNDVIISKGEKITDEAQNILSSLEAEYVERKITRSTIEQIALSIGLLIYNLIIILMVNFHYNSQNLKDMDKQNGLLPMNMGLLLLVVLSIVSYHGLSYSNILVPFILFPITAAMLLNFDFAILYTLACALIVSPFLNWDPYSIVLYLLTSILSLILIRKNKAFNEYLSIWFYATISYLIVSFTLSIYRNDPLIVLFRNLGLSVISATVSIVVVIIAVPFFQRKWNQTTKQVLLELLDFNHPLLKKLATEAVGTYHHSLIVGNLTERAAEAIGANPLLARVGSYYHDIGKIVNTRIFTENNEDSSSIHDTLTPEESAKLIKNHVIEGIELAQKYKIPSAVLDIIIQHHGTGSIRYFLEQAEKNGGVVDKSLYQYPGPRPQSKEAILVMIADIVESTTKAKNIRTEQDIISIIETSISRLLKEGQLEDAPITLKELTLVKKSMLPVLESIYRKRLDYPDSKDNEQD
ncbi:MAG: HDIG domain-containing protein [Candidatus Cloacimonetes bacterium]|nr:HDIG domain-containing protein [Candidatus Cloacimonadota bacterium]